MNIYTIPREIEEAIYRIDSCFDDDGVQIVTDEVYQEAIEKLQALQNKKDEIVEWYLNDRQNRVSEVKALEEEKTRLIESFDTRIKEQNKVIDRRNRTLGSHFSDIEGPTVFGNYKVSFTKSTETCIEDDLIPEEYKVREMKEIVKIPKDRIKEDLEKGIVIPGAILLHKKVLKIK